MYISYNKLWKLLIDKNMNKQDLKKLSGVSSASIAKLGKGENITTDVLVKICKALDCDITDIMGKYKKGALGALPEPDLINSLLSIKGNGRGGIADGE